jgi:DNA polymerase elongation subunit (family B)
LSDDVLVWDIETTPNIGLFWRTGYKITILPQSVLKERQICVVGYKWLSGGKARTYTWGKDADEETLVRRTVALLDRARYSIAHFGDSFDHPWLRARAMKYGIPMAPHYVTVDTKKLFSRYTYMNSNKLDDLGQYFALGEKIKTSYSLWVKIVTENHQPSLREMATYCRGDVDLLARLWEYARPWFPAPDSIARTIARCPHCGSSQTIINKQRRTAAGHDKVQFQCRDCGQYHTVAKGRYDKAKSLAEAG